MGDNNQVISSVMLLPSSSISNGDGRFLRAKSSKDIEKSVHSIGLFQQLQDKWSLVEEEDTGNTVPFSFGRRKLDVYKINDDGHNDVPFSISSMKILPSEEDMTAFSTKVELLEEEEELYRFASSLGGSSADAKEMIMKRADRQAMVDELNKKAKVREEAMVHEIEEVTRNHERDLLNEIHEQQIMFKKQQDVLNRLQMEFSVVALACVVISAAILLHLKR